MEKSLFFLHFVQMTYKRIAIDQQSSFVFMPLYTLFAARNMRNITYEAFNCVLIICNFLNYLQFFHSRFFDKQRATTHLCINILCPGIIIPIRTSERAVRKVRTRCKIWKIKNCLLLYGKSKAELINAYSCYCSRVDSLFLTLQFHTVLRKGKKVRNADPKIADKCKTNTVLALSKANKCKIVRAISFVCLSLLRILLQLIIIIALAGD